MFGSLIFPSTTVVPLDVVFDPELLTYPPSKTHLKMSKFWAVETYETLNVTELKELSEKVNLFLEDKKEASSSPTLPSGSPVGDIISDCSESESRVGTYSGVQPENIKKINKRSLILISNIFKV